MTKIKPTLKAMVAISIFATSSAWAALKPAELKERMGREVKVESLNSRDTKVRDLVASRMAKYVKGGGASTLATGLDKKVIAVVDGVETQVDLWAVADTIGKSADLLADRSKISSDLDAEAADLKARLESSVHTYADSLALVAGKVYRTESKEGKAIGKVLLMGSKIATGELSSKEAESYTELLRAMADLIRSGKAQTSEQALALALDQLQPGNRDQKIDELNSCKM